MDKHFLPEWLEKYSVFGLEMKLAWRRVGKWRIIKLLLIRKTDSLPVRILREIFIVIVLSAFFLSVIAMSIFQNEIANTVWNANSGMYLELLYPLVGFFFICIPAILGSDCFHTTDAHSFYKHIAVTGIRARRIASEVLASGMLKFSAISLALTLIFVFSLVIINSNFYSGSSELKTPIFLFLGLLILSFCIFIVSASFGATRLGLVNRRFVVLGFWLASVVLPVLLGYWLTTIHNKPFAINDQEFESNLWSFLASVFPLGSILTYPVLASGESISGDPHSYKDMMYVSASASLHILYSIVAYRITQKLFARRLSE
jgi:hypothetical protein